MPIIEVDDEKADEVDDRFMNIFDKLPRLNRSVVITTSRATSPLSIVPKIVMKDIQTQTIEEDFTEVSVEFNLELIFREFVEHCRLYMPFNNDKQNNINDIVEKIAANNHDKHKYHVEHGNSHHHHHNHQNSSVSIGNISDKLTHMTLVNRKKTHNNDGDDSDGKNKKNRRSDDNKSNKSTKNKNNDYSDGNSGNKIDNNEIMWKLRRGLKYLSSLNKIRNKHALLLNHTTSWNGKNSRMVIRCLDLIIQTLHWLLCLEDDDNDIDIPIESDYPELLRAVDIDDHHYYSDDEDMMNMMKTITSRWKQSAKSIIISLSNDPVNEVHLNDNTIIGAPKGVLNDSARLSKSIKVICAVTM
jgi:hypothetical protein